MDTPCLSLEFLLTASQAELAEKYGEVQAGECEGCKIDLAYYIALRASEEGDDFPAREMPVL